MELNKKTLIGTIGYHILGNHSVPPMLYPHLKEMSWPEHVTIDELNWGPVAVVQMFEAETPPFERVILLCAIERKGRDIGQINVFQWKGRLPDEEQIQACVGDAATGVISVENLLVIGEYFKIWKDEVFLVDVEPGPEVAGENWTREMEESIPDLISTIKKLSNSGLECQMNIKYLQGDTIFLKELIAE